MTPDRAFEELQGPISQIVKLVRTAPMDRGAQAGLMIMVATAFWSHAAVSLREANQSHGTVQDREFFRQTMEIVIAGLEADGRPKQ